MPKKTKLFTNTKAPIAHKAFSKEQFSFSFYNFKFNIKLLINLKNFNLLNINQILNLFFIIKNNFLNFETNLLFIKNFRFFLNFLEPNFFKLKY